MTSTTSALDELLDGNTGNSAGEVVRRTAYPATLAAARSELAEMRARVTHLETRERHFAQALRVADGGQYQNDWNAAISRVVAERDALLKALRESRIDHHVNCASHLHGSEWLGQGCNCAAREHNARIDAALSARAEKKEQ